jgi:antibiotic biosynthesis monooxygenase (ABM) superfamily enzyme
MALTVPPSIDRPVRSAAPSVHLRVFVTWLAVFPLVAIGLTIMSPFTTGWPPALRALVLTLIVVPLTAYLVVPRLLALHHRLRPERPGRSATTLRTES